MHCSTSALVFRSSVVIVPAGRHRWKVSPIRYTFTANTLGSVLGICGPSLQVRAVLVAGKLGAAVGDSGHSPAGAAGNVGYGAPLDTVVTFALTRVQGGTRLRLVHAGFELPKNDSAYQTMSGGWKKVLRTLDSIAAEQVGATKPH